MHYVKSGNWKYSLLMRQTLSLQLLCAIFFEDSQYLTYKPTNRPKSSDIFRRIFRQLYCSSLVVTVHMYRTTSREICQSQISVNGLLARPI